MEIKNQILDSQKPFFIRTEQTTKTIENAHLNKILTKDGELLNCWSLSHQSGTWTTKLFQYFQNIETNQQIFIVYFHGNGERAGSLVSKTDTEIPVFGDLINSMKWINLLACEYRGYSGSTGTPSLNNLFSDIEPIFQSLSVPEENIVVMGRSLGSIAAIEFIRRYPNVSGVIIESGIADPFDWIVKAEYQRKDVDTEIIEKFKNSVNENILQHQKTLSEFKNSVLILHTQDDEIFSAESAKQLYLWSQLKYKSSITEKEKETLTTKEFEIVSTNNNDNSLPITKIVIFKNGGHNYIWPLNWSYYSDIIQNFLTNIFQSKIKITKNNWKSDGNWWK